MSVGFSITIRVSPLDQSFSSLTDDAVKENWALLAKQLRQLAKARNLAPPDATPGQTPE